MVVGNRTMLNFALSYAKNGWSVLPLHSQEDGICTCGNEDCGSPAKHPRTDHGLSDATTDPETIKEWWGRCADANIGVRTGRASGIVVVDTDQKHGGPERWSELQDQHGRVDTLIAATGGGGNHWIFEAPIDRELKNTAGKIAVGIDTRAEGGYIVAPPSLHISGDRYEWEHTAPIAPLPDWVRDLWMGSAGDDAIAADRRPADPIGDEIKEGSRNPTLTSLAGSMRQRGMSEEAMAAALLVENDTRCDPALSEDEVRAIAASVSRYPAGVPATARQPEYAPVSSTPRSWPARIDDAAFHGLTGELVRAIAPHTEADPVSILFTHLVYAGNMFGRRWYATADAARHGTNLDVVIVGETSYARKGSSRAQVHRVYRAVDETWTDNCIKGGMSSGEGLIWNVRDPIEKTEAVKEKNRYTDEYQTHIVDQGVEDKRLLAYEPEFASVLRVMSRETNTLSTQVRQAWDSGTLRTMTKNNPAQATDAHISILGHITKDELSRELNEQEAANGFANRFLWVCAKRAQFLPEGGGEAPTSQLVNPIRDALGHSRTETLLTRDPQARIAWNDTYEALSSGRSGLFGAITARAEAQVLRLSVLYAALDRAKFIELPHLEAALAVWEYCEASAKYIFGDATGDPIADRILEGLRIGQLTRTEISYLFKRNVNATRIAQALGLLAQAGLAQQQIKPGETKSFEVWVAINRT